MITSGPYICSWNSGFVAIHPYWWLTDSGNGEIRLVSATSFFANFCKTSDFFDISAICLYTFLKKKLCFVAKNTFDDAYSFSSKIQPHFPCQCLAAFTSKFMRVFHLSCSIIESLLVIFASHKRQNWLQMKSKTKQKKPIRNISISSFFLAKNETYTVYTFTMSLLVCLTS